MSEGARSLGGCLALGCLGLGLLGAICLAAFVGLGLVSQESGHAELQAAALTPEELEQLLADLDRTEASGLQQPLGRERDCGPLLNPHLGLDREGYPAQEPLWTEALDLELLSERYLEEPEALPGGDFSLLEEARACDHWRPEEGGTYGAFVADPPADLPHTQPEPLLLPLVELSRLRVAAALRGEVPLEQALAEVHHLGLLLTTGESLIQVAVGLAVLKVEAESAAAAQAAGLLAPGAWETPSPAALSRLRRVGFAASAVYMGAGPPGSIERLAARGGHFGECGALAEGLKVATLGRTILGSPWPGERDLRPWLEGLEAAVDEARAAGRCRLPLAAWHWEHHELGAAVLLAADGTPDEGEQLSVHLPWHRQGPLLLNLALFREAMVDMSRAQR